MTYELAGTTRQTLQIFNVSHCPDSTYANKWRRGDSNPRHAVFRNLLYYNEIQLKPMYENYLNNSHALSALLRILSIWL